MYKIEASNVTFKIIIFVIFVRNMNIMGTWRNLWSEHVHGNHIDKHHPASLQVKFELDLNLNLTLMI